VTDHPSQPEYVTVVRLGVHLLVFRGRDRDDPRCTAGTGPRAQRCPESLEQLDYFGWEQIFVEGTDGAVNVLHRRGVLSDNCWIRQRCREHVDEGTPLLAPEWEPFDLAVHGDLVFGNAPLWTPEGMERTGARVLLEPEPPDGLARILAEALAARTEPTAATALYRYYAEQDALLYVGISDELWRRTEAHTKASAWMDFAVRSTIERHSTRKEAEAAETAAIKAEQPLFNDIHNRTPEAKARLVAFLIEHGRADLLAPSVSRG
jgi:predicted GIY-YIG superfamily endonuclease